MLERGVKTMSKKKNRKFCEACEQEKHIREFYNADEMFFPSGKLHICKDCTLEIVEANGHKGFIGLLRLLNKPYYEKYFKNDVPDYIRMMNSMPQFKNVEFIDSDTLAPLRSVHSFNRPKPTELTEEELKESEEFWGKGYTEEQYIYLNTEYADYLARYEVNSKTLENLIREICLVQLDIRIARQEKRDVKNLIKIYDDLLAAANLKPVQETGNQAVDQETFGTLIKKFENERPIPEPDEAWKDVDGIGKYIRTFFLGHMMRLFGKENPFAEEYEEEIGKYTVKPPKRDDN